MKQLLALVFAVFLMSACQSSTESTKSNETITVNPAHGQPGHRCDIAVGAPLS